MGGTSVHVELTRSCLIGHATERLFIDIACVNCKANDPPAVLIHDDHYPVALQQDLFAAE
jgi:hypothetical protein